MAHVTFVTNVKERYVAERMSDIVGVDSIHDSVWSYKLWTTMWTRPITFGMDTNVHARAMGF